MENSQLALHLSKETGLLRITDLRCGKIWEQRLAGEDWKIQQSSLEGPTLILEMEGAFALRVTIRLSQAELEYTLAADPTVALESFSFPGPIRTPDRSHYLLQTDGEGLLLAADDTEYPLGGGEPYYCGGGLAMTWMGVVDTEFATGYMTILETPFDARLETRREGDLLSFATVWLASLGQVAYERKFRQVFFHEGGYVAQCKRYRQHIWPRNRVLTLRQNEERFPAIGKILGAVHIYVWDAAREVSFAGELKAAGIEKAFLIWNPNHLPYPEQGYDLRLAELGYATGSYELFTDIDPSDAEPHEDAEPERFLRRKNYPGLFNQLALRKADGSFYSNRFGHYICPAAIAPEIIRRTDQEMALYPHESYFVDVWHANGLYECHHPEHPLTREQYAAAILRNIELLEDRHQTFIGAEWGADLTGSHGVYAHGMMTLQRTWFDSIVKEPGTIYFYGDWKNNSRPSQMLGSRTAPDTYLQFSINEKTRVPLYELVYHDAIVTSWRWEDCNHHNPEIWWKKDLFNILYGTAPLWSIDQERWAEYRATFLESYQNICPWLQEICYEEMLSHRFVNAARTLQETTFASGKRAVVNFGDRSEDFEGHTVNPRSHLTLATCQDGCAPTVELAER